MVSVRKFLRGEDGELFAHLEKEMKEKARNLEFEDAQAIKGSLDLLRWIWERQKVREYISWDNDIVVLYEKYDKKYIARTLVRWWSIIWVFRHQIQHIFDDSFEDILLAFISQQYLDDSFQDLPDTLILQREVREPLFHTFLTSKNIKVEVPKIGPKKELLDFTLIQLKEYVYKSELVTLEQKTLTRSHMMNVLQSLGYGYPEKKNILFECYDISHTDWHFTYASRVCIEDGKPNTQLYKKYKIRSLTDGVIDDFGSHREVMKRRTIEGLEFSNFPDLIIIDGGKWQLSSACAGIQDGFEEFKKNFPDKIPDISIDAIQICSIAKREEEVFLPNQANPVVFTHGSSELRVLQKARDESHRFSINANRSARDKAMKKNILEEIPGIGPVTRKALLKIAGSIDGIRTLELDKLQEICNKKQIEILRDHSIIP